MLYIKLVEWSLLFSEKDPIGENPYWGAYGTGKIDAESCYSKYSTEKGINLVILRPPYVYGEDNYAQRESFMFRHIHYGKPILLPITNRKLQFIYAADLAGIVEVLLQKDLPELINIYNVGNRESVTARQWVEACAMAAGKSTELIVYDHISAGRFIGDFFPFRDYDNVLNVDKIKTLVPEETDFIQGLRNSYRWFLKMEEEIQFKDHVAGNEEAILASLVK